MKKRFDLYGFQGLMVDEAAQRLETELGLLVEPHESSYHGGEYFLGGGDSVEELIVQANFEDEEGYLSEADFASYGTLVYVTDANSVITDRLRNIVGLTLLRSEVL